MEGQYEIHADLSAVRVFEWMYRSGWTDLPDSIQHSNFCKGPDMSIPYFRYVEYTDDGCGIDQCLSCYNKWEGRSGSHGWKFCPYCGVEWKGKLECRQHYETAWLYRLKQQNQDKWDEWDRNRYCGPRLPLKRGWVIEARDCREDRGETTNGHWNVKDWQSDSGVTTLRMVLSHLESLRRQSYVDMCHQEQSGFPWKHWTEYRARIIDFKKPTYSYGSSIWQHGNSLEDKSLMEIWKPNS